jgi:hypothetical protein
MAGPWAPAYDVNPNPDNPRRLTTAIDLDDGTCDVDLVLSVAGYFRLPADAARSVVSGVEEATRGWRGHAQTLGLTGSDIARMKDAFDNEFRVGPPAWAGGPRRSGGGAPSAVAPDDPDDPDEVCVVTAPRSG